MSVKNKTRRKGIIIAVVVTAVLAAALLAAAAYLRERERRQSFESLPAAVLHGDLYGTGGSSGYELRCKVRARQYFIYDVNADKMLCQKGQSKIIYPASTTKLVTALTALEYLSPDDLVTVGGETDLIAGGSSIAYVREGMTLSVGMLIEGMLLPSGNDAAYALAAAAGRVIADDDSLSAKEAVEAFVAQMNIFAEKCGMCGSHFISPDGYSGKEHYSTLEDMAIISSLALKSPEIRKYCSLSSDDVTYASGETNHWDNTNECLVPTSKYYNKAVTGLKTGSLDGYYNLIAVVRDGEQEYIIGVFGLEDREERFEDVNRIAEELF